MIDEFYEFYKKLWNVKLQNNPGGPLSVTVCPTGSAVPGLTNVRRPRSFIRKAHSLSAVACSATLP